MTKRIERCMKHPDLQSMSKYRKGVPLDADGSCNVCKSAEGFDIISRVAAETGKRMAGKSLVSAFTISEYEAEAIVSAFDIVKLELGELGAIQRNLEGKILTIFPTIKARRDRNQHSLVVEK